MNLRESLDLFDDGMEWAFDDGRQEMHYAQAFVQGYSDASGLDVAISTNGLTMQLYNLTPETPTNSAVMRRGVRDARTLRTMLMAQLDAIEFWREDVRQWRPVNMGEIYTKPEEGE